MKDKKLKIEVGQTYGQWTILGEVQPDKNGRRWLCQCSCGAKREKPYSSIRGSINATFCRCTKDLKGRQFGQWTVLYGMPPNKHKQPQWRCRCTCGAERTVTSNRLICGDSLSCGHAKQQKLAGQRFGELIVIDAVPQIRKGSTYWKCKCDCGTEKYILGTNLTWGLTTSCGCKLRRKGAIAGTWKGGRRRTSQGYIRIYSPGHPNADIHGGVLEHRLVMEEKILGRRLTRQEIVHHRNGQKMDNRPENLELFSKSHPSGQRISDLVAYAREILALYGDFVDKQVKQERIVSGNLRLCR